jgi:hypothetical protein
MKFTVKTLDEMSLNRISAFQYERAIREPTEWYIKAILFRRVAEEINPLDSLHNLETTNNQNTKDIEKLYCVAIYRFLMGVSFENLIKATIIAQGTVAGNSRQISNNFKKHSIEALVGLIDANKLSFNQDEINLLKELEKFVVWAGRYPIPKKVEQHDIMVNNFESMVYQNELALWKRFYIYLNTFPEITRINSRVSAYHNIVKRWFNAK